MPKKDGIEVVIELMPQKPEPGIIVLTHSAKEEDLRRTRRGSERRRDVQRPCAST
jgi:CheY-like chemotaxis protein